MVDPPWVKDLSSLNILYAGFYCITYIRQETSKTYAVFD